MTREGDPATFAAMKEARIMRAILVYIAVPGDPLFANNKSVDIPFDWNDSGTDTIFEGVGEIAGITEVMESGEQAATTISMQLSGIPLDRITDMRSKNIKNAEVRMWWVALDEAHKKAGDPVKMWKGKVDRPLYKLENTITIQVDAHDRRRDWQRPRIIRMTDQDQQARHAGDKFFEFTPQVAAGMEIKWGRG